MLCVCTLYTPHLCVPTSCNHHPAIMHILPTHTITSCLWCADVYVLYIQVTAFCRVCIHDMHCIVNVALYWSVVHVMSCVWRPSFIPPFYHTITHQHAIDDRHYTTRTSYVASHRVWFVQLTPSPITTLPHTCIYDVMHTNLHTRHTCTLYHHRLSPVIDMCHAHCTPTPPVPYTYGMIIDRICYVLIIDVIAPPTRVTVTHPYIEDLTIIIHWYCIHDLQCRLLRLLQ